MSKLVIIYDSKTGYTETMAKNIAKGAKTVENITVSLKKLSESTSYSVLDGANTIAIGSPSHNGHVTPEMLVFLFNIQEAVNTGKLSLEGKLGLAFGSYGWDGGICIEKLQAEMRNLGLNMNQKALAKVTPIPDSSSKAEFITDCQVVGKNLAKKTIIA
ncbi:MAG: flavodoxin domain-containing protein [Candidatus Bathyarchaeota archaeon]|nr:flavodoxin domain-containing protein [Candidatus Bathyarchaeota archaeon]